MLALVLAFATLAPLEPVRLAGTTLTQRVDAAEFICIGTTSEIVSVDFPNGFPVRGMYIPPKRFPRLSFAKIDVERVLKGDGSTKVAWIEAWRDNMCDSTSTAPGERAIYLLGPGDVAAATEADRAVAESALKTKSILRTVLSGGGQMSIRDDGEGEYVYGGPAPLSARMPKDGYALRLPAALDYIGTLVRFAPESVAVLAQQESWGAGQPYDVRILPDGKRRLAISFLDFERVTLDTTPEAQWEEIKRSLPALVGDTDLKLGKNYDSWDRRLLMRANGKAIEFWRNDGASPTKLNRESNGAYVRALRGWGLVRSGFDCEICPDDREADLKLIAELSK